MESKPEENKAVSPVSNKGKTVKVLINPKRAITSIGKAGDVVEMDETTAKQYERDGFVTILK